METPRESRKTGAPAPVGVSTPSHGKTPSYRGLVAAPLDELAGVAMGTSFLGLTTSSRPGKDFSRSAIDLVKRCEGQFGIPAQSPAMTRRAPPHRLASPTPQNLTIFTSVPAPLPPLGCKESESDVSLYIGYLELKVLIKCTHSG